MAHHGGRLMPAPSLGPPLGPSLGPPSPLVPPRGGLPLPLPAVPALPRVHRPHGPHGTPPAPPRPAPPTPPRPGLHHATPSPPLARQLPPLPMPPPPAAADAVQHAEVTEVSLAAPRPDGERRANEYVETPLQHQQGRGQARSQVRSPAARAPSWTSCRGKTVCSVTTPAAATPLAARHRTREAALPALPVRHQPTTFKKALPVGPAPHRAAPTAASRSSKEAKESAALGSSILCAECGRCRCAACQEPRPLPSRWLCEDTCFCSAETTLDYATCLCCVKGLFYHCGDEAGVWCADDPCSCAGAAASSGAGSRRCARWSCLALASVALPCLLCYWPLRGVVRATELCYARYCDDGCRCDRRPSSGAARTHPARTHPATATALLTTPEKRLLDTD